jgi:hypothetical protein
MARGISLSMLAPMMSDPRDPNPYRGNLGDAVRQRQRDLANERESERRLDLMQAHEERLARGQEQSHGLAVGQLDLQQQQLDRSRSIDDDKRFANLYDAIHQGDASATDMAAQDLARYGYEVVLPQRGAPAPSAAAPADAQTPAPVDRKPAGSPAAPASAAEQQTGEELDALRASFETGPGAIQLPPAPAPRTPQPPSPRGAGSVERQVRELELSPGDALLSPQPAPESLERLAAPADSSGQKEGLGTPTGPQKIQVRKGGQTVFEIDPAQLEGGRRKVIEDTFQPLMASGNEVQTQAAKKAYDLALGLLGTVPLKDVVAKAVDVYETEVDQLMGVQRAVAANPKGGGIGAGMVGPGMTAGERGRLGMVFDDLKGIISEVRLQTGVGRSFEEADASLNKMMSMLSQKNRGGLHERAALANFITGFFGKASSNRELDFLKESTGFWNTLENAARQVTAGGTLNEDLLSQLASSTAIAKADIARRRSAAGDMAYNWVMGSMSPMTPEERQQQAELARGIFTGRAAPRGGSAQPKKQLGPARAPNEKPIQPPAPAGTGPSTQQKWGLKLRTSNEKPIQPPAPAGTGPSTQQKWGLKLRTSAGN